MGKRPPSTVRLHGVNRPSPHHNEIIKGVNEKLVIDFLHSTSLPFLEDVPIRPSVRPFPSDRPFGRYQMVPAELDESTPHLMNNCTYESSHCPHPGFSNSPNTHGVRPRLKYLTRPFKSTFLYLRPTSHTRLRAHDHYTSSTLIGGKRRSRSKFATSHYYA